MDIDMIQQFDFFHLLFIGKGAHDRYKKINFNKTSIISFLTNAREIQIFDESLF